MWGIALAVRGGYYILVLPVLLHGFYGYTHSFHWQMVTHVYIYAYSSTAIQIVQIQVAQRCILHVRVST